MKAVRIHQYGPDTMVIDEVPVPEPGPGEVLVRISASSVNPIDWKIATGLVKDRIPVPLPFILGNDFSGVVEKAAPGVTSPMITDEVFGMTMGGGFAEYIVVKAANLAPKPASIDHAHAAGVPLAALTAWQGLFDHGKLEAGQRVLIHAAAGGVGSMAVQLALFKNATVYATGSGDSIAYLKGLGVEQAIDYKSVRFEDVARDMDVVFDLVGGDTLARSYGVLKTGGILVSASGALDPALVEAAGLRSARFAAQPNGAQLKEISRLVDAGELKVTLSATKPMSAIKEAMALSQGGHTRGKIVITVSE